MTDSNISILLKLFVVILVMYIFYVIINKISKSFATQCPSGQRYDDKQKKCIIICGDSTPFYDEKTEKCKQCPDDTEYDPLFDKCLPKCYKEKCGEYCVDLSEYTCIKDKPCLNSHVYRKPKPDTGCTGDSCTGATGASKNVKSRDSVSVTK